MAAVFTTTSTIISGGGGGSQYVIGRKQQVFPMRLLAEYQNEPISQRLVDAAHADDLQLVSELVSHPSVDVNFTGTVCLKSRKTEVVLNGESASEVRIEFEEFRTDVTALFLAAHNGNTALIRELLNAGANVNKKMFRGYATTAAVREGHIEVLAMLLNGGAGQAACEEALLEACYLDRVGPAELLMDSDMIRPHVAVHALVTASSRGFVDFVETLINNGVDANANARILLQSSKPSLYSNVDCNALVAAIVSRQISVVQLLLKAGCRTDTKVRLGAWSWDIITGEEFRVGACLAEPYQITWCAVEYFETSGSILRMLLHHLSPNISHLGRTIIHHAILCGNARAFDVLLSCGADKEFPVLTSQHHTDFRPVHMASRLGRGPILRLLINASCNLNSRTGSGESALMICARYKQEECLKLLASAGSDFGLCNNSSQCAMSIAGSVQWTHIFQEAVLDVIRSGKIAYSTNPEIFSSLLFATRANDIEAVKKLIKHKDLNLEEKDENGFSAVMVAAVGGQIDTFKLLVDAGADLEARNNYGETAITLAEASQNREAFAKVIPSTKENNNTSIISIESSALHKAARFGNLELVRELAKEHRDVINTLDNDGYTPLMLAAKSGNVAMCQVLISHGAKCDVQNGADILDELARRLVVAGGCVKKHTKAGKGAPHVKKLKMVESSGLLQWGKSSKRNVICRGAEVGPSSEFRWNRRRRSDADDSGVFRVVTTKNKEFHFSCEGGIEMAKLWVRGIKIVTMEAIFGRNF
ncbi:hypothetical protein ABFS82_05G003100 [Erythranthe guttata]|nr:PREDICTED: ankyrin repeat domain-containing protein 50-like [Erythranthe guttata]|eukprot:XP_012831687.1 PREDICTED: ankyrin repeat domain-containing protein 50-like [Erythranthe guttata]